MWPFHLSPGATLPARGLAMLFPRGAGWHQEWMGASKSKYVHVCICMCMYVYMYRLICIYICVVHMCACMYICVHAGGWGIFSSSVSWRYLADAGNSDQV